MKQKSVVSLARIALTTGLLGYLLSGAAFGSEPPSAPRDVGEFAAALHAARGHVLVQKDDLEGAEQSFQRATVLDPRNSRYSESLSGVHKEMERRRLEAEEEARRAEAAKNYVSRLFTGTGAEKRFRLGGGIEIQPINYTISDRGAAKAYETTAVLGKFSARYRYRPLAFEMSFLLGGASQTVDPIADSEFGLAFGGRATGSYQLTFTEWFGLSMTVGGHAMYYMMDGQKIPKSGFGSDDEELDTIGIWRFALAVGAGLVFRISSVELHLEFSAEPVSSLSLSDGDVLKWGSRTVESFDVWNVGARVMW